MMPWPFGTRVTVQRGTTTRFNDQTYADHHAVDGCVDYPTVTGEQGLTNTHLTNSREILMPPDADVLATDRILIHPLGNDGLPVATVGANDPIRATNTFQVVGLPKDWQNPFTGWHPGIQVSLERIT